MNRKVKCWTLVSEVGSALDEVDRSWINYSKFLSFLRLQFTKLIRIGLAGLGIADISVDEVE